MISTDKAVDPTSIMGATDRVAEFIVQEMNSRSSTACITVHFGNVLNSNGSVVPTFSPELLSALFRPGTPVPRAALEVEARLKECPSPAPKKRPRNRHFSQALRRRFQRPRPGKHPIDILLQCARVGPGPVALRRTVVAVTDWNTVLNQHTRDALGPLLCWCLKRCCPEVVPPAVFVDRRRALHANTAPNLTMAAELRAVMSGLEGETVPAVAYKGPALTAWAYSNSANIETPTECESRPTPDKSPRSSSSTPTAHYADFDSWMEKSAR